MPAPRNSLLPPPRLLSVQSIHSLFALVLIFLAWMRLKLLLAEIVSIVGGRFQHSDSDSDSHIEGYRICQCKKQSHCFRKVLN
ncbi:uncharacterized protein LOC104891333 [Beta vulgaris subsp. vulgaris]|uniref:uncharacterized protein LOC104891333 n=1 Tax=Beta vulgaris subsp. vulgaris TaxID=3555 RepID=UPI0020369A4D|nr:uncharacterized protein LOC104891333 [Beta vulgaris subsp. vulgaris]